MGTGHTYDRKHARAVSIGADPATGDSHGGGMLGEVPESSGFKHGTSPSPLTVA